MEAKLVKQLKGWSFVLEEDELIDKLLHVAETAALDAENTVIEFCSFADKRHIKQVDDNKQITRADLDAFSLWLNNPKKKKAKIEPESLGFSTDWDEPMPDVLTDKSNLTLHRQPTSAKKLQAALPQFAPPKAGFSSFCQRTQSGQVVQTLNSNLHLDDQAQASTSGRCHVEAYNDIPAHHAQHYMMDKLQDKVNYLESRISSFAADFEQATGCTATHPVYAACQEPAYMVGRICCDSEGRLNEHSILLEGSMEISNGARTKLVLSKLDNFKLFPGQVAVVYGANPAGACIVAQHVYTSVPKAMPKSGLNSLHQYAEATGAAALSLVVATGPFCSKEDALYEPLQALLDQCSQSTPDVVVLLGPFVDVNHPQVQDGTLPETFADLFRSQVIEPIDSYLVEHAQTHVVLVPSTQDMHHQPVFPQSPFPANSLHSQHLDRYALLPNPATFRCNEVTVGVVTSDVLKHLSGQEVQKGPQGDRLPGLAAHMLGQQSYYPIYPPAPGAMLDSSLASRLQMPCTPDIMLVPSDLNPFAKLTSVQKPAANVSEQAAAEQTSTSLGHVVCVNPGRLAKGTAGGTFARIRIAPSQEGKAALAGRPPATNGDVSHAVHSRCKASVIRI